MFLGPALLLYVGFTIYSLPTDVQARNNADRRDGSVDKEGFDTGRTAQNPFTGKEVPIPAGKTIRFKPGKELKELINKEPAPTPATT